jgi:hypothetical protein
MLRGNGRQTERSLLDAVELFGHLQSLVIVGADGEHGNDSRRVVDKEIAQQRQERLSLGLPLSQEQLLALVDRQHQTRRHLLAIGLQSDRSCRVDERPQQRLERDSTAEDRLTQIGARDGDASGRTRRFECA